MNTQQRIINLIIDKIKTDFSEDIKLAVMYGSFVTHTQHEKSDVDFFFVPKTERGWKMGLDFILEGIGYDFWGMPESRLRKIVEEFQPLAGILENGILLFSDGEKTRTEFAEYQKKIAAVEADPSPFRLSSSVEKHLAEAKSAAFDFRQAKNRSDRLHLAGEVLLSTGNALSALNRRLFKYGTKRFLEELAAMPLIPEKFIETWDQVFSGVLDSDLIDGLVKSVASLWNDLKQARPERSNPMDLTSFYEEFLSTFNKMEFACRTKNVRLGFMTAAAIDNELRFINNDFGMNLPLVFPDEGPSDLETLQKRSRLANQSLEASLRSEGVPIRSFADIEEFAAFLKGI
jgi:hypothetical protein